LAEEVDCSTTSHPKSGREYVTTTGAWSVTTGLLTLSTLDLTGGVGASYYRHGRGAGRRIQIKYSGTLSKKGIKDILGHHWFGASGILEGEFAAPGIGLTQTDVEFELGVRVKETGALWGTMIHNPRVTKRVRQEELRGEELIEVTGQLEFQYECDCRSDEMYLKMRFQDGTETEHTDYGDRFELFLGTYITARPAWVQRHAEGMNNPLDLQRSRVDWYSYPRYAKLISHHSSYLYITCLRN